MMAALAPALLGFLAAEGAASTPSFIGSTGLWTIRYAPAPMIVPNNRPCEMGDANEFETKMRSDVYQGRARSSDAKIAVTLGTTPTISTVIRMRPDDEHQDRVGHRRRDLAAELGLGVHELREAIEHGLSRVPEASPAATMFT